MMILASVASIIIAVFSTVSIAGVASFAVPLLNARWLNFALGQALCLLLAVGLWYRLQQMKNKED